MIKKKRPSIATLVSEKETVFLRDYYPRVKNKSELTAAFNSKFKRDYTICQVRGVLWKYGITSGRTGRIQAGNVPWNVFNKGTGRVKANRTSFVKGNMPANTKEMYAERININGYIEIKVPEKTPYTSAKTSYKKKHIWLWEQHHGNIKKGCCIVFLDGNRLNCALSNLAELSKAENLSRNRLKSNRAHNARFRETKKLLYKLQCEVKKARKRV